jgi:hypothetical protein
MAIGAAEITKTTNIADTGLLSARTVLQATKITIFDV